MEETKRKDYHTRSGEAVRTLMLRSGDCHLTAEDVHRRLSEEGLSLGLTTVYRQLDRLVAEGTVRKISGDRFGSCYQLAGSGCADHYHAVCTVCGALLHLQCEQTRELFRHITEEHGFTIDPARTVLYGTCRSCARKSRQKEADHADS